MATNVKKAEAKLIALAEDAKAELLMTLPFLPEDGQLDSASWCAAGPRRPALCRWVALYVTYVSFQAVLFGLPLLVSMSACEALGMGPLPGWLEPLGGRCAISQPLTDEVFLLSWVLLGAGLALILPHIIVPWFHPDGHALGGNPYSTPVSFGTYLVYNVGVSIVSAANVLALGWVGMLIPIPQAVINMIGSQLLMQSIFDATRVQLWRRELKLLSDPVWFFVALCSQLLDNVTDISTSVAIWSAGGVISQVYTTFSVLSVLHYVLSISMPLSFQQHLRAATVLFEATHGFVLDPPSAIVHEGSGPAPTVGPVITVPRIPRWSDGTGRTSAALVLSMREATARRYLRAWFLFRLVGRVVEIPLMVLDLILLANIQSLSSQPAAVVVFGLVFKLIGAIVHGISIGKDVGAWGSILMPRSPRFWADALAPFCSFDCRCPGCRPYY